MAYSTDVDMGASFHQMLYRRIQLAAAVFVIKSTPRDKTPEIHAVDLQEKLKIRWLSSNLLQEKDRISLCFDQRILVQQQNDLTSRLHSVISEIPHKYFEDFSLHPQRSLYSAVDVPQQEPNAACAYFNDLIASRNQILANANFIQAVIQLKALAESQSTIPMQQYIASIPKLNNKAFKKKSGSAEENLQTELLLSSDDSGFQTSEDSRFKEFPKEEMTTVAGVASSMLLYIISSCNADQLVDKSIRAILGQLKDLACANETNTSNLDEAMNQWKGSIYQQAVGAIQSIIGEHRIHSDIISSCTDVCFAFIKELIMDLTKRNITNKMSHRCKENKILLLLQLCQGTSLWLQTLEFIFSNLVELADLMKRNQIRASSNSEKKESSVNQQHCDIQLMEESIIWFRLLKAFLAGASHHTELIKNIGGQQDSRKLTAQPTVNSVSGLWRKHYNIHKDSHTMSESKERQGSAKSDVRRWKQILELSFGHILFQHPTIAVIVYECLQMLPTFSQ